MRADKYTRGGACSIDSLQAARAIFNRHNGGPPAIIESVQVERGDSPALCAARTATSLSVSSSMDNLALTHSSTLSLPLSTSPRIAAYRSVSGSSASLVSSSSSQGSVLQLDSSMSALNLNNESPANYHYTSPLQLVKHKLHRHTKHHAASQSELVLSHRENKLKATLRSQSDSDSPSSFTNDENTAADTTYSDGWGSLENSALPPELDPMMPPSPTKHHTSLKKRIINRVKRSPIAKSHHNHGHNHGPEFNSEKPWKAHRDVNYISRAERTRYEAMWMANRFRYLDTLYWWPPAPDSHHIALPEDGLAHSLVVREIWSRSNLAPQILAQIWRLVDTRHDGSLDRHSFIVGMWLVDQCLYGRKLPHAVPSDVWDSVDKFVVSIAMNDRILHKTKKKRMKKELRDIKRRGGIKKYSDRHSDT